MAIIEQTHADSNFVLYADLSVAKLLGGLCWCCGNPRVLLNYGDEGWKERCMRPKEFVKVPCKYCENRSEKEDAIFYDCTADGRSDGNCAGKLIISAERKSVELNALPT